VSPNLPSSSRPLQRGKNSTRVLSIALRKQARVTSNTYCRLVPGDIVELLYDQQGRYAYKVRCGCCAGVHVSVCVAAAVRACMCQCDCMRGFVLNLS
jgi:hypothetical protein